MTGKDDEGTVLLLTLGLSVVLLLLVAVVVDVSAVLLARRGLSSVADGAATSAAQRVDVRAVRAGGLGSGRIPLDDQDVADAVADYAADVRTDQPGITMTGRVEDGTTAVVDARRTVRLPFVGWLGIRSVQLHAQSRATSPVVP